MIAFKANLQRGLEYEKPVLKQRKGYVKISNTIAFSSLSIDGLALYIHLSKFSEKILITELYLREFIKVKENMRMSLLRVRRAKKELIKYNLLEIKKRRDKSLNVYEWILKDEFGNVKKHFNKLSDEVKPNLSPKFEEQSYQNEILNDNLNFTEISAKNAFKMPLKDSSSIDRFLTTEGEDLYNIETCARSNIINNNINKTSSKNLNLENLNHTKFKERKEKEKEKFSSQSDFFAKTDEALFLQDSFLNEQKQPLNQKREFEADKVSTELRFLKNEAFLCENEHIIYTSEDEMRKKFQAPKVNDLMKQIKAFNDKHGTNFTEATAEDFIEYWEVREWKRGDRKMQSIPGSLHTWLKNAKQWSEEKEAKQSTVKPIANKGFYRGGKYYESKEAFDKELQEAIKECEEDIYIPQTEEEILGAFRTAYARGQEKKNQIIDINLIEE